MGGEAGLAGDSCSGWSFTGLPAEDQGCPWAEHHPEPQPKQLPLPGWGKVGRAALGGGGQRPGPGPPRAVADTLLSCPSTKTDVGTWGGGVAQWSGPKARMQCPCAQQAVSWPHCCPGHQLHLTSFRNFHPEAQLRPPDFAHLTPCL